MNREVLQALLAAGIRTDVASRLASAIDQAYRPSAANSQFSADASPAIFPDGSDADRFALHASGPASLVRGGPTFGRGKAALGVSGLAVINGEVYCTGGIRAQALTASNGITAGGVISAENATVSEGFIVQNALNVSPVGVIASAPVVCQGVLVSQRLAQFNGPAVVNGPLSILGPVNWKGQRNPAQVGVISFVNANGTSVLNVVRREVAVLNDYGDINGKLTFACDAGNKTTVLTAASLSSATTNVTSVSGANFTASTTTAEVYGLGPSGASVVTNVSLSTGAASASYVTGATFSGTSTQQSLTVITAVGFDAEACAVTSSTTTVTVLVDCGGTVSLEKSDVSLISSVSATTETVGAIAQTVVVGVGGTVSLSASPVAVLSSVTMQTAAVSAHLLNSTAIKIEAL